MRKIVLHAFVVWIVLGLGPQASAKELVVDLSNTVVPITASFNGSDLLLFGAFNNDKKTDIIVVVRGPYFDDVVRQKKQILGVWANGDEVTFDQVPSYYYVAANRPIEEFLSNDIAKTRKIGINGLDLSLKYPDQVSDRIKSKIDDFRAGLIQTKQAQGLFGTKIGNVHFKGDRLFRTTIHFPANVPVGEYGVDVFAFRDNRIVDEHTTILAVQKFGLEAAIYDFAHRNALSYGIIAIILATMAGWLASVIFRKS